MSANLLGLGKMLQNFRQFSVGPDPFGRKWNVEFRWEQTAISIRHSDSVDVKFFLSCGNDVKEEKVIALRHPDLLKLSAQSGRPLTDPWCMKLAALHLKQMIETGEDMDKTLVTAPYSDLEKYNGTLGEPALPRK